MCKYNIRKYNILQKAVSILSNNGEDSKVKVHYRPTNTSEKVEIIYGNLAGFSDKYLYLRINDFELPIELPVEKILILEDVSSYILHEERILESLDSELVGDTSKLLNNIGNTVDEYMNYISKRLIGERVEVQLKNDSKLKELKQRNTSDVYENIIRNEKFYGILDVINLCDITSSPQHLMNNKEMSFLLVIYTGHESDNMGENYVIVNTKECTIRRA